MGIWHVLKNTTKGKALDSIVDSAEFTNENGRELFRVIIHNYNPIYAIQYLCNKIGEIKE